MMGKVLEGGEDCGEKKGSSNSRGQQEIRMASCLKGFFLEKRSF